VDVVVLGSSIVIMFLFCLVRGCSVFIVEKLVVKLLVEIVGMDVVVLGDCLLLFVVLFL